MNVIINGRRYIPAPITSQTDCMGEQLRAARKHAGLSLDAASEMLQMSQSYLWELENGRLLNPTLSTMLALMRGYGIGTDVFFKTASACPTCQR